LFVSKLTSNPVIDARFQHGEQQASSAKDLIMKGPDIKAGANFPMDGSMSATWRVSRPKSSIITPVRLAVGRNLFRSSAWPACAYKVYFARQWRKA